MLSRRQKFRAWFVRSAKTFNLLPDYAKAVYEAWQDYLWKALLLSWVIVWWLVASPPSIPAPPMLLVVAAFAWAFLVATYYTWRKERLRLVPQVVLQEIRQQSAPAGQANRSYIQLVMTCATEAPVEECKGWLVCLWKWSEPSNDWEKIEPNQTLRLNWSPGKDEPITLFPGVPEIIDVIFVSDRDPRVFFCSNWVPQRAQNINLEQPSLFKFEVVVHGKDSDLHKSLPALPILFKVSIQRWPVIDSIEQV